MKDILTAPWMVEMIRTAENMYRQGWDERNGGNISLRLTEKEVSEYLNTAQVIREIPTGFSQPELEGMYFLVTGTGKYFKMCPMILLRTWDCFEWHRGAAWQSSFGAIPTAENLPRSCLRI